MSTERKKVSIKAYSIGELAALYEISVRTMNRWLKPHLEKVGKREGRFYSIKQVSVIFEQLGMPGDFDTAG
ncbi:MAG: hypothetical protein JNM88_04140 [Chitinophagaceae bacterium]|nr:hypothetical protein [Chitinophagaceae bacterium]